MIDERLARRTGAIALGVAIAAVALVAIVVPRLAWRDPLRIVVTFETTGGLREGAPFVVAGRPVGKVERIALAARGVRVTVALERMTIPRGEIFVSSRGIVSERYLEIGPGEGALRDGDVLAGRDPPTLDQALQRAWGNLVTASAFAAAVEPEVRALRSELAALRANVATLPRFALGALPAVDVRFDEGGTLAQARAALGRLRDSTHALQANVARLGRRDVIGHLADALDRTRAVLDEADALLAEVRALEAVVPSGSLMRLLQDPEFPEDMKDLGKVLKRAPWRVLARPADAR